MKEYLITVTSEVTKHYLIDATSNNEAISDAIDYFIEGEGALEQDSLEMNNVKIKIESIGDADELD